MFKLTHPLPDKVVVAVSGGMDSMAALHWLNQAHKVKAIIHIHHNTGEFADDAADMMLDYSYTHSITLTTRQITNTPPSNISLENWWREQRYQFFQQEYKFWNVPIVTAHHADDCLEEYISCTMKRGYIGTIPYAHGNVIRPFRNWHKEDIRKYVDKHNIPYIEDPSNLDTKYLRNKIRHELVDKIKEINPGIYSLVEKAVKIQDSRDNNVG